VGSGVMLNLPSRLSTVTILPSVIPSFSASQVRNGDFQVVVHDDADAATRCHELIAACRERDVEH